jgi:hypothetical protein
MSESRSRAYQLHPGIRQTITVLCTRLGNTPWHLLDNRILFPRKGENRVWQLLGMRSLLQKRGQANYSMQGLS